MRGSVGSFVVALAVRSAAPLKTVAVAGRDSSEPVTVERTARRLHFSAMLRNRYSRPLRKLPTFGITENEGKPGFAAQLRPGTARTVGC